VSLSHPWDSKCQLASVIGLDSVLRTSPAASISNHMTVVWYGGERITPQSRAFAILLVRTSGKVFAANSCHAVRHCVMPHTKITKTVLLWRPCCRRHAHTVRRVHSGALMPCSIRKISESATTFLIDVFDVWTVPRSLKSKIQQAI
jgi:hypothetical protein